jgi:hypothetical protein
MVKDNSYHAVIHIMKAATFAQAGMHSSAHEYARKAYHHAQAHRDHLGAQENHQALAAFNQKISPMFTHLETILSKIPHSKLNKSAMFIAGAKPKIQPNYTKVKSPSKSNKYNYKPFHQLSSVEQSKVQAAFKHSTEPLHNYHYAVDKTTAKLADGQRWLAPKSNAPQASTSVKPTQSQEVKKSEDNVIILNKFRAAIKRIKSHKES